MAAYALGLWRQRAREAFEQNIRRGHGMWEVPVGFVRTEDHRLEKIADRQVQQALDGVFKKLRALGSARQTMRWYRDAQLPWPEVHPGTAGHDIIWQLPRGHRLHQMLTNPCYAGALVSGRTEAQTVHRRWTCPAEDTAEKATGAVAYRAAGAASWLQQLGHVSPEPTTLGGHRAHASRRRRWALPQRGPALLQGLAAVRALRPQAPGRL